MPGVPAAFGDVARDLWLAGPEAHVVVRAHAVGGERGSPRSSSEDGDPHRPRSPTRPSRPWTRRAMLPRCLQTTRAAAPVAAQARGGGEPSMKAAAARVTAPAIEPTETYRVRASPSANVPTARRVAAGARGRKAPAPVATPL